MAVAKACMYNTSGHSCITSFAVLLKQDPLKNSRVNVLLKFLRREIGNETGATVLCNLLVRHVLWLY
jgi:hypothetical protein